MAESLLSVSELACERDDRMLFNDLSFDVGRGEIVQIKGPNGAGKTTLLRALVGLYQSYHGQIFWRGQDIRDAGADYHRDLLFLGHKPSVKTSLTVLENLRILVGLKQPVSNDQLYNALDSVGLAGYEGVLAQNLSAGQHRRVSLARLFLSDASLWVLDEAFTAIDLDGVAELERFLALQAGNGRSIILTTHHRPEISKLREIVLGGVGEY